jgi:simple sugar transport system substrate-binding protein
MLAEGVQRAADEYNSELNQENEIGRLPVSVTVIEGGFNQAEWQNQVTVLAASGVHDLIVSSNPSLPAIVSSVSARFPEQKFLLMDGEMAGNPSVYTLRYNQREQAYMAGYIAALITLEAGGVKRLGLVAAQEYPVMNNTILPGFIEGARAVDPEFNLDFRIVGNWFDAVRAADIAADMIRSGITVLLPIAGGANEGVAQAAAESGVKVIWFDTNGYNVRPGTVAGSTVLYQDKATYEKTLLFLRGELPFGYAEVVGVTGGYVDFIEDDPLYISTVSSAIRERQAAMINRIRSGELILDN